MEEIKIRELPEKENIHPLDYLPIEDDDGTKRVRIKNFRALVLSSLYFENINELKNNSSNRGLKEGDICQTLGYYEPGDGGGALYIIKYDPAAVEDNMNVHYLSYSDTLRAEIILEDKINIHQFGAKGDGRTDDTKAIQEALNNSWEKTIEFTHGKKYLIREPLNVHNDNTIINGHGATLYPQYVNGLNISPKSDEYDDIYDVYINNLNIDSSKSSNSIYIYRSSNVHLYKSIIDGSTGKGVLVKNSYFVNIQNCEYKSNGGSCIVLDGDNENCVKSLVIENCKFDNFLRAVHVSSTGVTVTKDNISSIIQNCMFDSNINNSCAIYIGCPINYININDNIVKNANKFLYYGGASTGDVYCNGITGDNISKIFDFEASNGTLHLDGSIRVVSITTLFQNLQGKLHSNILWDAISGTQLSSDNSHYGELFDIVNPVQYSIGGYGISGNTLNLRCCHNVYIDWNSSTNNLESINGGFKGQLIYVKSSTKKSIISVSKKIILTSSEIPLGEYGIQLKYDGLQWVQVEKAPKGEPGDVLKVGNALSTATEKKFWFKIRK